MPSRYVKVDDEFVRVEVRLGIVTCWCIRLKSKRMLQAHAGSLCLNPSFDEIYARRYKSAEARASGSTGFPVLVPATAALAPALDTPPCRNHSWLLD